jgi:hypothetical protein
VGGRRRNCADSSPVRTRRNDEPAGGTDTSAIVVCRRQVRRVSGTGSDDDGDALILGVPSGWG